MFQLKNKDLITGAELSTAELTELLDTATQLKKHRAAGCGRGLLAGQSLALLFDKPSLRTRMSFTIAMNELGGQVIESVSSTRKNEHPQDLARVLSGYCHGIMVRTFDTDDVKTMATAASIPVINGLCDDFHPCQALADLLTLKESFGQLTGLTLAYIGDGNNILQSFFPVAARLGLKLHYACPPGYGPKDAILKSFQSDQITAFPTPQEAVRGADVVYTDVWASMGSEADQDQREIDFQGYQVNLELLRHSGKESKVMHCLPMIRGIEISESLPDSSSSLIFEQSANRLHVQKALLIGLLTPRQGGPHEQNTFRA